MKNIQTVRLKMFVLCFLYPWATSGNERVLQQADSLFAARQYTQSFELYKVLLANDKYSPAMLLKMAYIQEGLGHIGQSLYYLNLYELASGDEQARDKMEELAARHQREGYTQNEAARWAQIGKKNESRIFAWLGSVALLLFIWLAYQKIKKKHALVPGALFLVVLGVLLTYTWAISHTTPLIITSQPATYLMSAPSAGADVVAIVSDGHRLETVQNQEAWIKAHWGTREVYIRNTQVLVAAL